MKRYIHLLYKVKAKNRRLLIYTHLLETKEIFYNIKIKRLIDFKQRLINEQEVVLTHESFLLLKETFTDVINIKEVLNVNEKLKETIKFN
jgi:hypothetical protein